MQNNIHFISGLPRAGSTLLAALLRQNPRFHASMSGPMGSPRIYEFIGEPFYAHDRDHVPPCAEAIEFDKRLGTPGLHSVGSSVIQIQRRSILPTDLFKRHETFSFWEKPEEMPHGIRLV